MFTIPDFIRLLDIEHNLIHTQTEGLTQADTLIQPQPSGNCMNWVLGHLLDNQITLLTLLGAESPVDPALLERYRRDSEPVTGEGPGVLTLERLPAWASWATPILPAKSNSATAPLPWAGGCYF